MLSDFCSTQNLANTRVGVQMIMHWSFVSSAYHDYVDVSYTEIKLQKDKELRQPKRKGLRGGVKVPFPVRLYKMMQSSEEQQFDHIVSWRPHGRAFKILIPMDFETSIIARFFHQTKLKSFQRQLNWYGFRRLTNGTDRGAYYHELFLRGRPELCEFILRNTNYTGHTSKEEEEPNLSSYPISKGDSSYHSTSADPTPSQDAIDNEKRGEPTISTSKTIVAAHINCLENTTTMDVLQSHNRGSFDIEIISDEDLRDVLDGWNEHFD